MSYAKTKKKPKLESRKQSSTDPQLAWDQAEKLPLGLFHTTMGPVIGHVGKATGMAPFDRIRIWAPALLRSLPGKIAFLPIAFAETWFDMSSATPSGTSPVPAIVGEAYKTYFANFREGKYGLVAASADAQGPAVEAKIATAAPPLVDSDPKSPIAPPEPANDEASEGSNGAHVD